MSPATLQNSPAIKGRNCTITCTSALFTFSEFDRSNTMEGKMEGKKMRSKGWTEEEEICLIEEVNQREAELFGEAKGCGSKSILRVKMEGWQAIADVLNGRFTHAKRERMEIKKKFFNLKQRAKSKIDNIKNQMRMTGGGPAPPELSTAEESLIGHMEGRPGMLGLEGGVDTDEIQDVSFSEELIEDEQVEKTKASKKFSEKSKSMKRSALDEALIQNTKEDTERIMLEKKKLKLEIEFLEKKQKTMEAETQMLNAQSLYFQLKLQSEFGVSLVQNES